MEKRSLEKLISLIRLREEATAAPTNNVGGGQIAGTVEAGDDPPVRKKKKYIYMKGVRKTWKPKMAEQVKVAVLEERLQNFESIVTKLDSAIEKLAEVNNNVSRMLAVHEERITKQEEIDSVLFDKIDKLRDKMDFDHDSVTKRLSLLERKLWIGIGALGAVLILTNPQAIKTLRPLLSSAESAIIQPVSATVNGLR